MLLAVILYFEESISPPQVFDFGVMCEAVDLRSSGLERNRIQRLAA
jgi:hypothetical protein